MFKRIIGWRGIEASEIIMYLSRIFYNMGFQVVICDYSPINNMKYYIPFQEEVDVEKECVEYRGIGFTRQSVDNVEGYNVYLINFGFGYRFPEISLCDHIFFITDMNKANIKHLSQIEVSENPDQIVIKDYQDIGVGISMYIKQLKESLKPAEFYTIRSSKGNLRAYGQMQYNDRFKFQNINNDFYAYLTATIERVIGGSINSKAVEKALKKAMKGE